MATKRKSTRRSGEGGSTLYGVLAGLLIGLVLAAVVAFYVTRTPMPFVDRASRDGAPDKATDPRQVDDPNQALYGRDGPAGNVPTGPTADTPTSPLPGVQPGGQAGKPSGPPDDLGALIATLPPGGAPASSDAAPAAPKPAASGNKPVVPAAAPSAPAKPAVPAKPATPPAAKPADAAQHPGNYYLQAGAFRGQQDAEALRARILLLGMPVNVQRGESNGAQINRVRVGPFARLDDMNRARSRLGENKIESTVVRQQ